MKLHPCQKTIVEDNHRFKILLAGRRFGKTVLAVEEMIFNAVTKENSKIVYIAPTFQSARDIALEQLKKRTIDILDNFNETRLEVEILNKFGGKSKIFLRSWDNIETLRGQAFDFIVLDEVAQYKNFWPGWQEVLRPCLTDRKGSVLFISTPSGFNHFYDLYNLEAEDKDYKSFHFTSYDNPCLPKDELEKAKQELTEDRFAQEYMADFRKTEGLVYKEFNRERHVFSEEGFEDEDFTCVKTFGGVDFGFTNPAAVYTIKKDKDANYWITDEWYKTHKTDAQIADYVSALTWNECYPDPENAGGIRELEQRGVNVREVIKGKGSIKNGINVVRELFKANRLFIHTSCKNLIWELETYSYPDKKSDHNEEENPIDENNHAVDSIRYALSMEPISKKKGVSIYRPDSTPIIEKLENNYSKTRVNAPSRGYSRFR